MNTCNLSGRLSILKLPDIYVIKATSVIHGYVNENLADSALSMFSNNIQDYGKRSF